MKTTLRNILPYFVTSFLVIIFWKIWTSTDNYAFNPVGKESLMLDIALTNIFIYKTLFWLVIANLLVFAIREAVRKQFKTLVITLSLLLGFYFLVGAIINKKCAFHYYSIFINQSTMEELITRPILEAGYHIGPILTENIERKEMKNRIYAIGALEIIKYKPATNVLEKILYDKSEKEEFRATAFEVLTAFDTEETNKILINFEKQATESSERKVIELGEHFIESK